MFKSKGFMNYQRKQLAPDLTPLIDVVFLLLIFFMVATTFDDMRGMKIDLPKSEVSEITEAVDKISILVASNGELKLKIDKKNKSSVVDITKEKLQEEIKNTISLMENKRVAILADRGIDYGDVVDIMSDIKMAGAQAIDIETKGK
ncbi:ExbD/TolR family protein [Candidatus Cetobacterium colombiensis]|uniref:Biopolymer transporter ExbD n=1 Tax=Candidatus Cetobacterium colombiensis TaxID=3073100 RepID=A0ABU4W896_9FUSO|nr:biopolymer transporter ExbD [Candidatus Cetobacterium colombiensis]MDX8335464.1 biopolymer transporter ExbD [Candidatus Cetobacterium colombiensis]